MYYVSMTDKFMSGWGEARGKTNKLVVACDTLEQANQIENAANRRSGMKHVCFRAKKPYYPAATHLVTERHYNELGGVWHEN